MNTGQPPVVVAQHLVKRFGDFTAVAGIDVEVAPGEAFGFLGPNGAGKTSTMRMIGCVSPPTDGVLRIFGLDPVADGRAIRARMGVVPQLDQLDNELTVTETSSSTAGTSICHARKRNARPPSCSTSSS
jgi:lipooligosaccharide transport system ATP-binding protein